MDLLEDVVRRGCIGEVRAAFRRFGAAVAHARAVARVVSTADANGITALSPNVGCAGNPVRILGSGFGPSQPTNRVVLFPTRWGGCMPAAVLSWGDTEVRAEAPQDVGVGPVGFRTALGEPPGPGPGQIGSAAEVADVMGACFGPTAFAAAEGLRRVGLGVALSPPPCPPALPTGANVFTGGPPAIDFFQVNGSQAVSLIAGDPLELRWSVRNAATVAIARLPLYGMRNQLPDITGPLNPGQGTRGIPAVRATYGWSGVYELRASNSCTPAAPVTARVTVEVQPRPRPSFLWGVATAGYQVEGGITNNDWHVFTSSPAVKRRVEGLGAAADVDFEVTPAGEACRHADLAVLRRDLDRARLLGANAYRFSVEWSRVQPSPGTVDQAALNYYRQVVQEARNRGMTPVGTLNHLTLPSWVLTPPTTAYPSPGAAPFVASLRGWENPVTVDRFIDFVRAVVGALPRVPFWLTLNEPVGCMVAACYVGGVWLPGFIGDGVRAKTVYFNLLRAHVRAYDAIKVMNPQAQVSIAHNMLNVKRVAAPGIGDIHTAARNQVDYFYNQHILDALTSGTVDTAIQRRPADRTPVPSDTFFGIPAAAWTRKLDFLGVNYYRAVYAFHDAGVALTAKELGGRWDENMHTSQQPHNLVTDIGWEVSPEGLGALLQRVHDDYGLPVLITENGIAETEDRNRAAYLVVHLEQIEQARANGVNMLGYLHWSLLDNYEWAFSYQPFARFGLYNVDRDTLDTAGQPTLARRMTEGALAFQYLAAGASLANARDRFGSFSSAGDALVLLTRSAGALWEGAAPNGFRLALYLTLLSASPAPGGSGLLGMVFDFGARRWVRLDDIVWDPASQTLTLFHFADPGVGEREYVGVRSGDRIQGTFREGVQTSPWQVDRVWPHGQWSSDNPDLTNFALNNVSRWEEVALLSDDWGAKRLQSTQALWQVFGPVAVNGANIQLDLSQLGVRYLGAVTQATMEITPSTGPAPGSLWTGARAPDDLPF